uniref:11S globulin n=1 Tax=Juglans nigra TaxID=16719 RepID=JUGN4_JUGNI|nr:RecName: Full=11S globulin; AltName: Full=11S legumin; AltName: Allergen=Jug n 4; Contains: RecName: Full=11S globulin acidic chain; Contains: RecName: Full=11S globulin basic chain; Flags: Precursor [Juglans nigra]APR62629.1 legumin [Juglans nigra]
MAKPILLSISLCLVALVNGCLAQSGGRQQPRFGECKLKRLVALEPSNRIEAEAGVIESWDPNNQQFQCAGVAVVRRTIEPNGLLLPQYSNAPQLLYIVKGRGITGVLFPGCPETFEESQQGQSRIRPSLRSASFQRDRHQKIRHFREGDVIAFPAGVAHWCYNDGDTPVVAVALMDTTNNANQLDQNPRNFYLAGNPDDEFRPQGQQEYEQHRRQQQHQQRHGEPGQQQRGSGNNVFSGFDADFLADAFNVDTETARRLQSENDHRRSIVRVEGRQLQVIRPRWSREEQEREERKERERERESESERRQSRRGGRDDNGLEETICTLRLRENIGDPSRADIYTEEAGRISTANSHTLPVLRWLQLSAERGALYSDALYVPHWNLNAHSVVYALRGRAEVQVVDNFGQTVFDDELREGQLLTIPQNFAVVKRARNEGFEWVSFKTNENAMVSPLAGRTSAIRALPEEVLANALQIPREDARRLKFNRQESTLVRSRPSSSRSSRSERRAEV